LLLLLAAAIGSGCKTDASGPAFSPAPEPSPDRGRVYIYRADSRGSRSSIRVTLNGREVGRFQNGQYETLEVSPGPMRLRASMRGLGWVTWGWNDFAFRVRHGETVFVELSVRLEGQMDPVQSGPRDIEIAGRPTGHANDNVFILRRSYADAMPRLRLSSRIPQPE